ncbi:MAG TPA: class II aldolase/adducin family protein [Spirochaetota bacterium]|nr:class II aldolase/adducin family protein [Spirochaetota bacterium]
MDKLTLKYTEKLVTSGLCAEGEPLFGTFDDEVIWNSSRPERESLDTVIRGLNINSILFSDIAEPYRSIVNYLAQNALKSEGFIRPDDTETRTFLHDIPVAQSFHAGEIINSLKKRKGVIIPGRGIVTYGTVSPEQAFIFFSSICFSCYVKFMTDYYYHKKGLVMMAGDVDEIYQSAVSTYGRSLLSISDSPAIKAPFKSDEDVIAAITETGKLTVESRMVDSFFGNISVKYNNKIFISQTGSSLDELSGCIDPCPVDNSTTNAITSSSEFSAHKGIYGLTDKKSILHGHPKYSVIMSMLCDKMDCENRGKCHIKCSSTRMIDDIPIVPGEVGTGPTGISRTLPPAMSGRGAIVFGHGLFTSGQEDFTDAFGNLIDIEKMCFKKYIEFLNL